MHIQLYLYGIHLCTVTFECYMMIEYSNNCTIRFSPNIQLYGDALKLIKLSFSTTCTCPPSHHYMHLYMVRLTDKSQCPSHNVT